ncbi:MAG: hypothetical protein ABFC77_10065 [Thermoguttaceae bacterium]
MTKSGTGISNVLNGILSTEARAGIAPPTPVVAQQPPIARSAGDGRKPTSQKGSRRGRPLGKTTTPTPPKEKVTVWLSSDLVASYRDWSWDARSQFSHLVERALTDYHRRQRTPKPGVR